MTVGCFGLLVGVFIPLVPSAHPAPLTPPIIMVSRDVFPVVASSTPAAVPAPTAAPPTACAPALPGALLKTAPPAAPATVQSQILLSLFVAVSVPPCIISATSLSVASHPQITDPPAAPARILLHERARAAFHAAPPTA